MVQRGETEQRVDRGEASVPAARAVTASGLQVVQERADGGGVKVGDIELARRLTAALLAETQPQPEGVAIRGDGMRAAIAVVDQSFGEERLKRRGECAHDCPPAARSTRSAARASSCLLYTSPSPRDGLLYRMPSS